MKRKKEILLLALLIVALTLYLVFRRTGQTNYEIPQLSEVKKEEVSRLEVTRGETETTLEKQNGRWVILPDGFPADPTLVDAMVNTLAGLKLTALASEARNFALYDLGEDKRIQARAFNGDKPLLSLEIGKAAPSFRHTFVKLPDDTRIFHAAENFRSRFEKDAQALRDKQVMKIEDEISEVLLAGATKSLQLRRQVAPPPAAPPAEGGEPAQAGGAGQTPAAAKPQQPVSTAAGTGPEAVAGKPPAPPGPAPAPAGTEESPPPPKWQTDDGRAVKEKEIDTLVTTLSNLKCDGFVPGKKKEELTKPSFTVSLKGARDYEFSVFDKENGKFVCTSSESDYPFLLPEWRVKKIQLDPDSLIEK